MREGIFERQTRETDIRVAVNVDGTGDYEHIHTGVGFFDHMLQQLAAHSGMDLVVKCSGDLHVDAHHTVEDCGIAIGSALSRALGDRCGIQRYASAFIPMDEALAVTHLDLGGRAFFVFHADIPKTTVGQFDAELCEEFFRSVAMHARMTLHMDVSYGSNVHHIVEALFKSFARALSMSCRIVSDQIPSTKGVL